MDINTMIGKQSWYNKVIILGERLKKIFNHEICVCAHLTQTRYAQRACAEKGQFGNVGCSNGGVRDEFKST